MRSQRLKYPRRRIPHASRSVEAVRALVATAGLAGLLLLVYVIADSLPATNALLSGAQAANAGGADARAKMWEHRVGSIVISSWNRPCEERTFDNNTGRIVGVSYVDCDARLATGSIDSPPHDNTSRMRGILASFKK